MRAQESIELAKLSTHFDDLASNVVEIKERLNEISELDKCISMTGAKVEEIDRQLGTMSDTMTRLFDQFEKRFQKVESTIENKGWGYIRNIGVLIAMVAGALALIKTFVK